MAVGRPRFTAAALLMLAATSLPAYLAQREPYAKPTGMDYSAAADVVKDRALHGDFVLLESNVSWNPTTLRAVLSARPDAFSGLVDVGRGHSALDLPYFWDENLPVEDVRRRLHDCRTVWLLTDAGRDFPSTFVHTTNEVWTLRAHHLVDDPIFRELRSQKFTVTSSVQLNVSQVVRLDRTTT